MFTHHLLLGLSSEYGGAARRGTITPQVGLQRRAEY